MRDRALIAVVDDDESVRESLPALLSELGHEAVAYASAVEYLGSDQLAETNCLLLDLAMPGMSGTDLQKELIRQNMNIPIIFITAHGDDRTCGHLRALGAVDCLLKPFTELRLIEALNSALGSRLQT